MRARIAGVFAVAAGLLAACGTSETSPVTSVPTPSASQPAPPTSSPNAARTPLLVLEPAHGALGAIVHVTGSGYGPRVALTGTICALDSQGNVGNPLAQCDITNIVTVTTDAQGGFVAAYTLKRLPTAQFGYQIGFGTSGDSSESAGAAFAVDP